MCGNLMTLDKKITASIKFLFENNTVDLHQDLFMSPVNNACEWININPI
jgi:uncharacterized protein YfaP (DUF2135 family)